jgi:hypothetical protein
VSLHRRSTSLLIALVVAASFLLCPTTSLWLRVIRLDIAIPSGSEVSTKTFRTDTFPGGWLVWDRHYRIPEASFISGDAIMSYFDEWLVDHGWIRTDACQGTRGTRLVPLSQGYIFFEDGFSYYGQPKACLNISPEPVDGYYDVWLVTYNPGLAERMSD